jgi:hypothetical protein
MSKVLITNAGYGNTLAIIRSMAKEGIEVVAGGIDKFTVFVILDI